MRLCLLSMLTQAGFYLWYLSLLIRDPPTHGAAPVWQPPTRDSLKRGGGREGGGASTVSTAEREYKWKTRGNARHRARTLFLTLSQDCRLAKIWLSMACTHSSRSSYVDASKFHVWPVSDTMMNSKESSCSAGGKTSTEDRVLVDTVQWATFPRLLYVELDMFNANKSSFSGRFLFHSFFYFQLQFKHPLRPSVWSESTMLTKTCSLTTHWSSHSVSWFKGEKVTTFQLFQLLRQRLFPKTVIWRVSIQSKLTKIKSPLLGQLAEWTLQRFCPRPLSSKLFFLGFVGWRSHWQVTIVANSCI